MSTAALRWIRTLSDNPNIPDSAVVWPESSTPGDHEPRFAEEERPTRISSAFARMAERRTNERATFLADLEFSEDARFFTGRSLDISEGGLFVSTYTEIPLGTRLLVAFELPDGTAVEARGEVRWCRTHAMEGERPGIGITFTELTREARERIAAFCERRPPLQVDL